MNHLKSARVHSGPGALQFVLLWEDLVTIFIVKKNGLHGARLSGEQNRLVISRFWIYYVGLIFIVHLKYAWGYRHAGRGTDTGIAVNHDLGNLFHFHSCGDISRSTFLCKNG